MFWRLFQVIPRAGVFCFSWTSPAINIVIQGSNIRGEKSLRLVCGATFTDLIRWAWIASEVMNGGVRGAMKTWLLDGKWRRLALAGAA